MKSATAAAEPLEDPPGVCAGLCGLRVCDGWLLANSVVTVLPRMTQPACLRSVTHAASAFGRWPRQIGELYSVGKSAVSMMSLMPKGTPCRRERRGTRSSERASASAALRSRNAHARTLSSRSAMRSRQDMAPKVSQGVTTVIAGNCGCSLAPAPNGMRSPVIPPLDLLDDEGGWFRFPTFREYVEELVAHPPATNCALLVGHTMLRVQTMDKLE